MDVDSDIGGEPMQDSDGEDGDEGGDDVHPLLQGLDEGILIQLMESEELFASLLDDSGEIDPGSLAVVVATLSGE